MEYEPLTTLKVVCLGDTDTGKTSLLRRYCKGEFSEAFRTTIGVEFEFKTIALQDNSQAKVMVWDTAGQERGRGFPNQYCRGAHGVMAVYSITRKDSFDTIDRRLEMLKAEGVVNDPVFMLVGNKCDLESLREVSTEHGQEYAKRHGYLFVETSAKESTNVDAAFDALIAACIPAETSSPEPENDLLDSLMSMFSLCVWWT